ncbi:hypothetical protein ACFFP0_21745 [Rhizobium puerariae]|uniref:Uncharacterized protein n=1 Tax=Rhizobium puerariae TaxID=1585791 RepID=A0ABV6ALH8_9HYPH
MAPMISGMDRMATGLTILTLLASGAAAAMPSPLTVPRLLDICLSSTVSEATAKGNALGWGRMKDQETEEWRTNFLAYNGGSVDVIGWRRGENEGDGLLSFWIAKGPNSHRACSYSLAGPSKLLAALIEQLGTPGTSDKSDLGTTAYWKHGSMEVSFSQFGSSTIVNIAHND